MSTIFIKAGEPISIDVEGDILTWRHEDVRTKQERVSSIPKPARSPGGSASTSRTRSLARSVGCRARSTAESGSASSSENRARQWARDTRRGSGTPSEAEERIRKEEEVGK